MLSRAATPRTLFLVSFRTAAAAGVSPPLLSRSCFRRPLFSPSPRLLSSATPYPLYYELISYRAPPRSRRWRRRSGDEPPAASSPALPIGEEDEGEGKEEGEEEDAPVALDRSKRRYYRKREKRLYGDSESEGEGGSRGPSEFVELEPEIVDFPRLHAREEELYFYDAMAFPWEKEKHYRMVYQLEKKYFPDQSLEKAFLESRSTPTAAAEAKEEEGGGGGGRKDERGLVFFDQRAAAAPADHPVSEKKVEEFFKCLKKVPSASGGGADSAGEPWLASKKKGLPPRWDRPSGTVLLVDKPKGWTSFTVCGKLRRLVKVQKVGHAGTLDPMATGLLIVCLGKATKVVDRYQAMFKGYSGVFRLGEATSTWDADSPVIQREPWEHIKDEDIRKAAASFCGEIWQVPPMFSAIKVGGERMYEKARRGETVELSPRRISIFQFDIERSLADRQNLIFRVTCSKGTYIRSLCADFGKALGSCAHLTALRRDSIGQYSVDDAWDFQELQDQITKGYL